MMDQTVGINTLLGPLSALNLSELWVCLKDFCFDLIRLRGCRALSQIHTKPDFFSHSFFYYILKAHSMLDSLLDKSIIFL